MVKEFVSRFSQDEDGAVTVDWVVLTAAIVGIGLAVITVVAGGVGNVTAAIDADINQAGGYDETVVNAFNGTGTD
ncbi:Flp family type IVb pilin [Palleronia sp. KMU-117]|uniref:Flp family type IVb pilin n=1 Tax=Palleronia sp. KMU-117 TaxID=3434108 RepID=UPI003D75344C